jgi:hypothetical protein
MNQSVYVYKMDNLIKIYSTPEKAIEGHCLVDDESYIRVFETRSLLKNCTVDFLVTKFLQDDIIVIYNPAVIGIYFTIEKYEVI